MDAELAELEERRTEAIHELGQAYWRWRSWYAVPHSLAGPEVASDLHKAVTNQEAHIAAVEEQIKEHKKKVGIA